MVLYTVLLCLVLLPIVTSQNISVMPSTTPALRATVTMSCSDSLATADAHTWSFSPQGDVFVPLMDIESFMISNVTSDGNVITSWTRVFDLSVAGAYRCDSLSGGSVVSNATQVLASQIIFAKEHTDVEAYRFVSNFDIMCQFQSAPTNLNLEVTWCFQLYTYPTLDESSCNAIPSNAIVLPIFPTQNLTSSNRYTSTVRISNVTEANAGFYRCNMSNNKAELIRGVRVRVRDNIEILWPAIGIIIQLVIITVFILINYLWDSYKGKQKKIERTKKEDQNLVSSGPVDIAALEDEQLSNEHLIKVVPT